MRVPRNTWPTETGFRAILHDCAEGGYELDEGFDNVEDWRANVTGNASRIRIRCKTCGYATAVIVRNFHHRKSARCFCTHSVRWNTPEGHAHFLDHVARSTYTAMPEVLDQSAWLAQDMHNHSRVRLKCKECGVVADKVEINKFTRAPWCDCACRNRTQRMVYDALCGLLKGSGLSVVHELRIGRWESNRPMCIDIGILDGDVPIVGIEVDGGQHFRERRGFRYLFEAISRRDVTKEIASIAAGIHLIRIVQDDAWKAKFDWKTFCLSHIRRLVAERPQPCIHRQPSALYFEGEYREARVGSVLEF